MRNATVMIICVLIVLILPVLPAMAQSSPSPIEQAMSTTLDLWREGRYEQLFEHLSHRGKTTREQFVRMMREAQIRPACCWQKMENFRLLAEKRTTATAYVKVGLEGTPTPIESSTREFKFTYENGAWRMQLNDILSLAGVSKSKKGRRSSPEIHRYN